MYVCVCVWERERERESWWEVRRSMDTGLGHGDPFHFIWMGICYRRERFWDCADRMWWQLWLIWSPHQASCCIHTTVCCLSVRLWYGRLLAFTLRLGFHTWNFFLFVWACVNAANKRAQGKGGNTETIKNCGDRRRRLKALIRCHKNICMYCGAFVYFIASWFIHFCNILSIEYGFMAAANSNFHNWNIIKQWSSISFTITGDELHHIHVLQLFWWAMKPPDSLRIIRWRPSGGLSGAAGVCKGGLINAHHLM